MSRLSDFNMHLLDVLMTMIRGSEGLRVAGVATMTIVRFDPMITHIS